MKKVLIVNQHTNNHGDEAAGIALIRELKNQDSKTQISVLYNWYELLKVEAYIGKKEYQDINHYSFESSKLDSLLIRLCLFIPSLSTLFIKLSKSLSNQFDILKSSDMIINGPGGVNIGPYKDYHYLWRLFMVTRLKKKLSIYSISFGPLDGLPKIFKKRSIEVLKYADFISLRDDKSHRFGTDLGLKYYKSIDTAFLSKKDNNIPEEYKSLNEEDYVVIVPNELYKWHPYFKNIDAKKMDDFYITIAQLFLNKFRTKVVFLPQLFSNQNDMKYMIKLKEQIQNDDIIVINSKYNSDIQQKIIAKSQFVVGARYHTIIFSINNNIPFYALSYEHKMENMLSLLSLSDYKLDLISSFQSGQIDVNSVMSDISSSYTEREKNKEKIIKASKAATEIAKNTFNGFKKNGY